MSVVTMHQINELLRHTAEVEDGRVCVKASGVELVAVLHGYLSKRCKILSPYCLDHLCHPTRDNRFSPVLCTSVDALTHSQNVIFLYNLAKNNHQHLQRLLINKD